MCNNGACACVGVSFLVLVSLIVGFVIGVWVCGEYNIDGLKDLWAHITGKGKSTYKDYCCGEFWESEPKFCCPYNFRPIRNTFFFLLISFLTIFTTILIYLGVESIANSRMLKLIGQMKIKHETKPGDSEDSSLDEDSVLDDPVVLRPHRVVFKHSQSFKDMSRMIAARSKSPGKDF